MTLGLVSCDPKDMNRAIDLMNEASKSYSVADGLKEALRVGVDNSVKKLSASNGFKNSIYKILLPEEAAPIIAKLRFIPGFDNFEDKIIDLVNKSAEDAAKKAGPIFASAITSMSFDDATQILMGKNNAATQYLHNKTYSKLYGQFTPVIKNSLNKFGAVDYWADAIKAYNKIPFIKKMNPDITDHVSTKALEGLFSLVEKKEQGIRTDVTQRTSDLLKDIFSKQDK